MAVALDRTRAQVALIALFLSKAEARDKICRTIQYGSKFISGGEPGPAQNVEKTTSLARKVFRLAKWLNEVQALLTPAGKNTPLTIVLLQRIKSVLMATFFGLDQVVWLGRTGLYQHKENTDLASKISLYCFMTGSATSSIIELCEIVRLQNKVKKAESDMRRIKDGPSSPEVSKLEEDKRAAVAKQRERLLTYVKNSVDVFVGIGLLQLAPKTITPRVTGALGTITALIACYQLFPPSPAKSKAS